MALRPERTVMTLHFSTQPDSNSKSNTQVLTMFNTGSHATAAGSMIREMALGGAWNPRHDTPKKARVHEWRHENEHVGERLSHSGEAD